MTKEPESLESMADRLEAAAAVIRVGDDPEGVHELRVTCRRTRVGLEIAEVRALRDDLRRLIRALGLQRDLDVLLLDASDLPEGLRAWADARRAALRPSTLAAVDDARFRGLVRALRVVPHPTPEEAADALPRFEREVRKAARRLASASASVPPAEVDTEGAELGGLLEAPAPSRAHALRRRIRKLRYAREWAGASTRKLVKAQEAFGVLSDETLLVRCTLLWQNEGGEVPGAWSMAVRRRLLEALGAARDQFER